MTDIETLLGAEADNLLLHRCQTIAQEKLYLPCTDFIDRVMIDNNRPNPVLAHSQSKRNKPIKRYGAIR
ncbi:hypothetical protein CBG25_04135 [Arsenophonus sp. ENCA]|nr:hypothetical protein CBG25_04135 [Arsenophonus sp. ENCA]